MGRFITVLLGVLVWALLSGCATNVSVDYDKNINFTEYKTYGVLSKSEKSTEDVRLNSTLIDKRIVDAIGETLAAKGFVQHPENQDFHLTYQINLQQEIDTDRSGATLGFGTGMGRTGFGMGYHLPSSDVESFEKAMLTIDVVSAATGELLWRGTSSRRIAAAGTPAKIDRFFKSLVKEILETFPPPKL